MAEQFTSYVVDNDKRFERALDSARRRVTDLTIPLTLISKDFYKSEQAIFQLSSAGQYPDFTLDKNGNDSVRNAKINQVGFDYPLLKRFGDLERSVTNPSDTNAINLIVNKTDLFIGTEVPYAIYHQSDRPRSTMPLRKVLFIGPESRFANSDQAGRPKRWVRIIRKHVIKKLEPISSRA